MKFIKLTVLIIISTLLLPYTAQSSLLTDEEKQINTAALLLQSTVIVSVYEGKATAFYIRPNELITNHHVTQTFSSVFITNAAGQMCLADVVYTSIADDLSLLKTDCAGTPLKVTEKVRLGQTVLVMGNPIDQDFFLSKGIVSSLRMPGYILHDAVTDHGNSGGAVVNLDGEVIAVTKGIFKDDSRMSAAVSSVTLDKFLEEARK